MKPIHYRLLKETAALGLIFGFYHAYVTLPLLHNSLDRVVTPAVAGITMGYGKITSYLYSLTGVNLGFVTAKPDPEFEFEVRLATNVNKRSAAPLFAIASDTRLPRSKREQALLAIKKFDSPSEWVESFLNELPRGGLLQIQSSVQYDQETPIHDELMLRIRATGGIRQTLVRAYAEVVFSFMLQHPTEKTLSIHALRWISDVLAEDALFLLIPRLGAEKDPKTRVAVEKALLDVRAVSDPETARARLLNHYKKPAWPELRFPLAVVLARLGHGSAVDYLHSVKASALNLDQQLALRMGVSQVPYPRELKVSAEQEKLIFDRNLKRQSQHQAALEKQRKLRLTEKVKQGILAKKDAAAPDLPPLETAAPTIEKVDNRESQRKVALKKNQKQPRVEKVKQEIPAIQAAAPPVDDKVDNEKAAETTYFEASGADVIYYDGPMETAGEKGRLKENVRFKAILSEKNGPDRWFLLEISPDETGWVRGIDIRLFEER